MPNRTLVPDKLQGYLLQVRHMLYELISVDDRIVSIEKLDDVAVEADGKVIAEQVKSVTSANNPIAVEANLVSLSTENAAVFPLTTTIRKYTPKGDCKSMLAAAEKLGIWCSGLTLLEVSKWLKVMF